jgi:hypothetical protein
VVITLLIAAVIKLLAVIGIVVGRIWITNAGVIGIAVAVGIRIAVGIPRAKETAIIMAETPGTPSA